MADKTVLEQMLAIDDLPAAITFATEHGFPLEPASILLETIVDLDAQYADGTGRKPVYRSISSSSEGRPLPVYMFTLGYAGDRYPAMACIVSFSEDEQHIVNTVMLNQDQLKALLP